MDKFLGLVTGLLLGFAATAFVLIVGYIVWMKLAIWLGG